MKRGMWVLGLALVVVGLLSMVGGAGVALATDPPPLKLHLTNCDNIPLWNAEVKVTLIRPGTPDATSTGHTNAQGNVTFELLSSQVGDVAHVQYRPMGGDYDEMWFVQVIDPMSEWIIGVEPTDHCMKEDGDLDTGMCCDSHYAQDLTYWHIHYIRGK